MAPNMPDSSGEGLGEEPEETLGICLSLAVQRVARISKQRGQPTIKGCVGSRRPQLAQVGRRALIQIEELVAFGTRQLSWMRTDLLCERGQAPPRCIVGANELVDRCDARRIVAVTTVDGYGSGSIITPEAVVLDFELAGLGSRSIAYAIDIALQFIVLIGFLFFVGLIGSGSGVLGLVILLVGLIVIVLGYSVSMETFNRGRTVGRMVVKTRVVTVEGAPVRFRQAFIRSLLGIVDLLLTAGTVAVVSSLITKRGQRLGDLVAGTMVIRDPANKLPSGALHFYAPHYLVGWAQTVDTQGLGNDGYQLVRDFLTRHDLDESAHARLADDVALLVSERLPHAARPLTVPSMDYLTAIATATQGLGAPPAPPPTTAPVIPRARWGQPTTRPAANLPPPPGVVPRTPVANVQPPSGFEPGPPAAVPPVTPTPASHTPVPRPDPPNDGGFSTPR